ncbi:hypothetical protein MBANPS3_012531 [Mucor bainieri]
MKEQFKKRAQSTTVQNFRDATNDYVAANHDSLFTDLPTLSNIVITDKIKTEKRSLKHESKLSKKEYVQTERHNCEATNIPVVSLLYYNIIDFVSGNKDNATRRALGDDFSRFAKVERSKLARNNGIAAMVNSMYESHPNMTLKQMLKEAKRKIREAAHDEQRSTKKDTIKALKVFQDLFEENRSSLSESEYLYLLVRPLLKIVLKDVKCITMIW